MIIKYKVPKICNSNKGVNKGVRVIFKKNKKKLMIVIMGMRIIIKIKMKKAKLKMSNRILFKAI